MNLMFTINNKGKVIIAVPVPISDNPSELMVNDQSIDYNAKPTHHPTVFFSLSSFPIKTPWVTNFEATVMLQCDVFWQRMPPDLR